MKQFTVRQNYNKKVIFLREEKVQIRKELEYLGEKLKEIHEEIDEENRKEAPVIREWTEAEFPERHFEINVELKIEEEDETMKENSKPVLIVTEETDFDLFEKNVLPKNTKKFDGKEPADIAHLDFESLCSFSKNEKKDTFWESDIRSRRAEKKLFDQDVIIEEMNRKITNFDEKIGNLSSEKFRVQVDAKLVDIFLVTLHQELIILKEFEALEHSLQTKVNDKISEVLDMRDIIEEISQKIIEHNDNIEKANEEIKEIQVNFTRVVGDNKFFDFLRRVFKKKYKPPRVHKDDGKIIRKVIFVLKFLLQNRVLNHHRHHHHQLKVMMMGKVSIREISVLLNKI